MEEYSFSDEEQNVGEKSVPKKQSTIKEKHEDEDKSLEPNYQGEITSKKLAYGPLDKRKCTDICMLIFFLVFWGGVWAIAIKSYLIFHAVEVPSEITDQFGSPCGNETSMLYFVNKNGTLSTKNRVCISQCPTDETSEFECSSNLEENNMTCSELTKYPTKIHALNVCWPTNQTYEAFLVGNKPTQKGFLMRAADDLEETWWVILIVGIIALALGFLYLILLKHFSAFLVWGSLIVFIVIALIFGLICFAAAHEIDPSSTPESTSTNLNFQTASLKRFLPEFAEDFTQGQLHFVAGICFLISFLAFVAMCYGKNNINVCVAVLKTATDFLEEEKKIIYTPPLFFIKSLIFYSLWLYSFILLVGVETDRRHFDENNIPLLYYEWKFKSILEVFYFLFALFWNHHFGAALFQYIVAGSACSWYFKQGTSSIGISPVWPSAKKSLYHIGSIAYGSLMIGVFEYVKAFLGFVHKRINKSNVAKIEKTSSATADEEKEGENCENQEQGRGFCASCCDCLMNFFERYLKYLNHHAYIQMAMTGNGFWKSTKDAHFIMQRNPNHFKLSSGLSRIFLLFGRFIIAYIATYLGYLFMTRSERFAELDTPLYTCIFFLLISYLTGDVFAGIYLTSADSVIHCFAMDEEMNDGMAEYVPKDLMESVGNNAHKRLLSDYD